MLIEGEKIFSFSENIRVKTNLNGEIISVYGISTQKSEDFIERNGEKFIASIEPNEEAVIDDGMLKIINKVDFKKSC